MIGIWANGKAKPAKDNFPKSILDADLTAEIAEVIPKNGKFEVEFSIMPFSYRNVVELFNKKYPKMLIVDHPDDEDLQIKGTGIWEFSDSFFGILGRGASQAKSKITELSLSELEYVGVRRLLVDSLGYSTVVVFTNSGFVTIGTEKHITTYKDYSIYNQTFQKPITAAFTYIAGWCSIHKGNIDPKIGFYKLNPKEWGGPILHNTAVECIICEPCMRRLLQKQDKDFIFKGGVV